MVHIDHVTKRFADFIAVDDVSLEIRAGEFITLLGPSGCGKTTILRMLSGLETPTSGRIFLDDAEVTNLPPYRRDVNQVFQSYALFPHLNVADNIAFGLRMKKVPRNERTKRVAEAIEMVELTGLDRRKPSELSGGQKQRVALARAIVNRPKVLLLDEPLAALDAKLRRAMQIELKRLQHRLGITFVFVTHDQEEALVMSDRIAVMNHGKVEQIGDVSEIYHRPQTSFVASFIGQANLIKARVVSRGPTSVRVKVSDTIELTLVDRNIISDEILISVRPEKVSIQKSHPPGENVFEATIEEEIFQGPLDQLLLKSACGLAVIALVANESATQQALHAGEKIYCQLHRDDIVVVR
jgi:spermidine/putrescine transport system ATP-binding protein